jgi:hypothetical protein
MNAVVLSDGVAGDGPARELVWLVDVRRADGSTVAQRFAGDGVFDSEELAEDEAVALAASLGLPLEDERNSTPADQSELCQDLGGAA